MPTRLSVAAADCVIALTIAVTRKDMVSDISDNRRKPSKPNAPNQSITLERPGASNVKKVKPTSITPELSSNMEMRLLLWNLLGEVIILVQRLIAVCPQLIFFYSYIWDTFSVYPNYYGTKGDLSVQLL